MPHPGMGFGPEHLGDPHGPGHGHAPEVIAHQVDDHDVLRPVLARLKQRPKLTLRNGRHGIALCRSLDGGGVDLSPPPSQEQLG